MKKLTNVKQLTKLKYLNMFQATFENDNGKELKYNIASRKSIDNLAVAGKRQDDAVRIIPFFYEDNKTKVVLIKEFRYPINDYIFGVPAGLIDEGERPEDSAKRELEEEIGASVISLVQTEISSFSSAGMSDESLICFEAEVKIDKKQNLGDFEDIEIIVVDLDELENMLDTQNFGLQSRLQLRCFLYKNSLKIK